jgi:hypothetical protein
MNFDFEANFIPH